MLFVYAIAALILGIAACIFAWVALTGILAYVVFAAGAGFAGLGFITAPDAF